MMAVKLFLTLLEVSVALSPVILLLLLVSPFLGKRYGARARVLVWLVLAVRLMIPLNTPFKNAIQLHLFPGSESYPAWETAFSREPAKEDESGPETGTWRAAARRSQGIGGHAAPVFLATGIWVAGAALFLLYHFGAYRYTQRRLNRWSVPVRDGAALRRLELAKAALSVKAGVRLFQSSKVASPLLTGFFCPRIILPDQPLSGEQLDFMLRHELWHLKRGDLWYKLILLAACALHWFNPLIGFMGRRANLDTELACDTDVLRGTGRSERKAYGDVILSFTEQGWRCKTPLTSKFYGGKKQMKQRFYNIADRSLKKRGTALLCAVALVSVLISGTVYAAMPGETPKSPVGSPVSAPQEGAAEADPAEPAPESAAEIPASAPNPPALTRPVEGGYVANDLGSYPGHTGVDIAGLPKGAPVLAAAEGTVVYAEHGYVGYGTYIVIDHGNGFKTLYAHNSKLRAEVGVVVKQGEIIAEIGRSGNATGYQLHFEFRHDGEILNPADYVPGLS